MFSLLGRVRFPRIPKSLPVIHVGFLIFGLVYCRMVAQDFLASKGGIRSVCPPCGPLCTGEVGSMGIDKKTHRVLLLIVAASAIVYILTFSRLSSYDSLSYFKAVEMGSAEDLVHPHHLIYLPLQKAWFMLWQMFGFEGRAAFPMKVLSLVGTCLAVWVVGLTLCFAVTGLVRFSALVTGFAFAYLTWHFASQAEPVPYFLLFSTLGLYLMLRLLRDGDESRRAPIIIGLVNALGVLFHQELVLMVPFSAAGLWLRSEPRSRRRALVVYFAIVLIGVVVPYLLIGRYLARATNAGDLVAWASGYLSFFKGSGFAEWSNIGITVVVKGIVRAFVGGEALKAYVVAGAERDYGFYLALVPYGWTLMFITVGAVALVMRIRSLLERFKALIVLILGMTAVFGFAAAWWGPQNRTFWSPVIPCILLIAGFGYTHLPRQRAIAMAARIILLGFAALLIWGNLTGGILAKKASRDEDERLLVELQARVDRSDIVILAAGRHKRLVDYYAPGIRALAVVKGQRGETELFRGLKSGARRDARETLAGGGSVFMSSEVLSETQGPEEFLGLPASPELDVVTLFTYTDSFSGAHKYQMLQLRLRPPEEVF